jgi:hypothetical protein
MPQIAAKENRVQKPTALYGSEPPCKDYFSFADHPEVSSNAKTKAILWNMNRRKFWEYSAALAVTTCTSPLLLSAQTASASRSSPASDALNPSGVRVAGFA